MGKATITANLGGAKYNITVVYAGRSRVNQRISDLNDLIAALDAEIAGMPEGLTKEIAKLRRASYQREVDSLSNNMPDDLPVNNVFCADFSDGLSGDVGLIIVPGERRDGINIIPDETEGAAYNSSRDGQLLPAVANSPEQAYFNRAILPGWQKWKPTYRYGTIVADSINFDNDTCDVCLDPAYSSQQNLDVNQNQGFSDCPSALLNGFNQFCADNPGHPACTNTNQAGGGLYVDDALYATIKNINSSVNAAHEYETDASGYEIGELWRIMNPGDSGDCEDFALTKMQDLLDAGVDIRYLQLAWGFTETGGAHAVLLIRTSNRGTLVLDNRFDAIKRIENVPYRFESYQRAGQSWANYTIRLTAVPVEYSTCNAEAFADNDRVIIKFVDQDWNQPKVIGFKEGPARCDFSLYCFFGANPSRIHIDAFVINLTTRAASSIQPGGTLVYTTRELVGSFKIGGKANIIGGWANEFVTAPAQPYGILNTNTEFNLNAFTWTEKPAIIVSVRSGIATFSVSGKGYAIGGGKYFDNSEADGFADGNIYNDNIEYDPTLIQWTAKTNCPISRMQHRAFVLNGKPHVYGGHDRYYLEGGSIVRDIKSGHQAFDPSGDSWESKNSSINERTGCSSTEIAGKGYSFGAWKMSGLDNTEAEDNQAYNPDTDSWSAISHPALTSPFTDRFARESENKGYIGASARFYYEYEPGTDTFTSRQGDLISGVAYAFNRYCSGEIA